MPVFREDLCDPRPLELGNHSHLTWEGVVPVNRIEHLVMKFRFPRAYGLRPDDVTTFVGSYTQEIDYFVESEHDRCDVRVEALAGSLEVILGIQSPLLRHAYGVAWTPRSLAQMGQTASPQAPEAAAPRSPASIGPSTGGS